MATATTVLQTPAFQAALRAYVDECLGLGAAILRGIALGLQLPETFFEGDMAGVTRQV
jgi:isopenicillin N synthase-like dioxygenase